MNPDNSTRDRRWPDLHINDAARTIEGSLRDWLTDTRRRKTPATLTLLAGYVSIRGLLALTPTLAGLLRDGVRLRLLLGVAPSESAWVATPIPGRLASQDTPDPALLHQLLNNADHLIRAEID